jgi:hypothetical protein
LLFFIYTALREPLPKFLLPFEKHPYHALKETERDKAREKRRQQTGPKHSSPHQGRAFPS